MSSLNAAVRQSWGSCMLQGKGGSLLASTVTSKFCQLGVYATATFGGQFFLFLPTFLGGGFPFAPPPFAACDKREIGAMVDGESDGI